MRLLLDRNKNKRKIVEAGEAEWERTEEEEGNDERTHLVRKTNILRTTSSRWRTSERWEKTRVTFFHSSIYDHSHLSSRAKINVRFTEIDNKQLRKSPNFKAIRDQLLEPPL